MKKLQLLALLAVVLMAATALAVNHSPPATATNVDLNNEVTIDGTSDITTNSGMIGTATYSEVDLGTATIRVIFDPSSFGANHAMLGEMNNVIDRYAYANAANVCTAKTTQQDRKGARERRFLLDLEMHVRAANSYIT